MIWISRKKLIRMQTEINPISNSNFHADSYKIHRNTHLSCNCSFQSIEFKYKKNHFFRYRQNRNIQYKFRQKLHVCSIFGHSGERNHNCTWTNFSSAVFFSSNRHSSFRLEEKTKNVRCCRLMAINRKKRWCYKVWFLRGFIGWDGDFHFTKIYCTIFSILKWMWNLKV